jgi:hypothetical protein
MKNHIHRVACLGLALGGPLETAGSMVAANLRATIFALDAVDLVTAAFILAFSCRREENEGAVTGFWSAIHCLCLR